MKNLKNTTTISFKFLICSFIVSMFHHASFAQVSPQERQALIDLYNATDGDNWTNTVQGNQPWLINDASSSVSDWFGVTVVDGRVNSLILENNNLLGVLSISLSQLSTIEIFNLANNSLSGTIPLEIFDLVSLKSFVLGSNQISGEISSRLGQLSSLQTLDLRSNQLSGTIPSSIGGLSSLSYLNLSDNGLEGSIPPEIGQLNIDSIYIRNNQLTGSIPLELGNITRLRNLSLNDNNLTGSIPTTFGQLINLEVLSLQRNSISGIIPVQLTALTKLKTLGLSNNFLQGNIPFGLSNITSFFGFTIDNNRFNFSNLENNFTVLRDKLSTYFYAPQAKVDETETISVTEGGSITLTSTALTSPNNSYQWYKDGVAITGAISKEYVINSAASTDAGVYHFLADNSIVTDLTLERNPVTLEVTPAIDTCGVSEAEKQALIDLFNSTDGPNWTSPWDLSLPVCDWGGVTVVDGKVTKLYLFGGGVSGPLPNSIGDLIHLTSLTITRSGGLTGGIPSSIGNLVNLESIDLSSNNLSDPLPVEIGNLVNLKGLNLYRNRITGPIPTSIGNLTNLIGLTLGENLLTGSIPTEIGNLTNLTGLNLFQNQLTGSIPFSIGNLTNLTSLALSRNGLTGAIPTSIVNLSKLTGLDISSNKLSDPIPPELGNMINLTGLNLYRNRITGSIPAELANLTNLTGLVLGENLLSGSIPVELATMVNLTSLNLFQNQLTGEIPEELGNLVNLVGLTFARNGLTGSIPQSFGNLVNLESLYLDTNQLTGSIPSTIGNLSKLKTLSLFRNGISGELPTELGNLTNLESFSLESNRVTGSIPDAFGNMTSIRSLNLAKNELSGSIPSSLGNLPNLTGLGLGYNMLSGDLPSGFSVAAVNGVFDSFGFNNNNFVFADFESQFTTLKNNLTGFAYLAQARVDEIETRTISPGESITLSSNSLTSPNNSYQWYKNGVAIDGATNKDFVINNASDAAAGVYYFTATNSIITDLTLTRNTITLEIGCGVSPSEKQALVDLYNSTNGPNWTRNTNWLTDAPVCDWYGVVVENGKVTRLSLALNGIDGPLPSSFSDLIYLESVTFERNRLSGEIPESIGNMTNLTFLHLGSNLLTGEIPASLGNLTNLTALSLYRNRLGGTIPVELGNLSNLEVLNLFENGLTGVIPSSIGNLSKLTRLMLYINRLEGPLPAELGNLLGLVTLHLERNVISGEIPSSLGNLSSLEYINLGNNRLSGNIPSTLGNLNNLKELRLFWNALEGNIPSELTNIPNLEIISLSRNSLSGALPEFLGTITTLTSLDVRINQFSGNVPESIGNLPNLTYLGLASNNLAGKIPSGLSGLASSGILTNLTFSTNNFVFSDFENEFQSYKDNVTTLVYAPQAKVDQTETVSVTEGGSITLTSTALTSPNNSYQWYKDGVAIAGATSKDLVINTAATTDAGVYHFLATNSIVTDLTLERNPITVTVAEDTCGVSAAEKQALIDLYNSTDGDNWINSWDLNAPVCEWIGVTVLNGKVTDIRMGSNNMIGTLPASIGNLIHLTGFEINTNEGLTGSIPQEIGNLVNLEKLLLHRNNLTGSIPSSIGQLQELTFLALFQNDLSGSIPNEIGNLSKLHTLYLERNQLNGSIPPEIGNMSSLLNLSLWRNQLSGSIPVELGNLSRINGISLAENQLSGAIPKELGNLSTLKGLSLNQNQLTGSIPAEFGNLTELSVTYLNDNNLSGNIPSEIGNLSNLKEIRLGNNQLSGQLPNSIGNLVNLEKLYIDNNSLEGEIPSTLGNLTNLKVLSINNNDLIGLIPDTLTSLSFLEQITLEGNNLEGNIPNFTNQPLNWLSFKNNSYVFSDFENEFTSYQTLIVNFLKFGYAPQAKVDQTETVSVTEGGSITLSSTALTSPNNSYQWYKDGVAITGATSKEYVINTAETTDAGVYHFLATNSIVTDLTLERNPITVTVAEDTCGVSAAEKQALIDLYNSTDGANWINNTNWLTDAPVCDWYGVSVNATGSVTSLSLSNNNLSGEIPSSIGNLVNLVGLNLSENTLTGILPTGIGQLTNLVQLYIHTNQITGPIPVTIGNLSSLQEIVLSYNELSGALPAELGQLTGLKALYLQENNLSGSIPPELGGMTSLTNLFIHDNNLSGAIPAELGNLARVNAFVLSNNQLSGEIPSELGNLSSVLGIYLQNNQLSGVVPSSLRNLININDFQIQNNKYVFSGIESEFDFITSLRTHAYAPQAKVDETETVSVTEGGSITLTSTALTSPNNSYQWYKDGVAITGATSKDLVLSAATIADAGVYHFLATNSIVTDLTLERNPITVTVAEDTCGVSAAEKQALIDLYNSTDGPNWTNNTNWLTDAPVCDWYGITVVDGKVTRLQMNNNGLKGAIPSSIGSLTNLERLVLSNNAITGSIPSEIGQLILLNHLDLLRNQISGTIPVELGNLVNIEFLHLAVNQLSGAIPEELGSLTKLTYLNLGANNLSGGIPQSFANLTNLRSLFLFSNNLEGTLPDFIGSFSQLNQLVINNNSFSGELSASLGLMPSLNWVRIHNNQFSGKVPFDVNLPSAFNNLYISVNKFVFADFEDNFDNYVSVVGTNFRYIPQAKVDETETVSVTEGGSITLTSTALTSPNNSYQWYKDGVAIAGATSKDLVLSAATIADAGVYHFLATNSIVTDLTLERNPITVTVAEDTCGVSAAEKQALIDLYNSTDGPNWTNNTNWLTDAPVCDWYGVTVRDERVKILSLNNNNLSGEIPSSILDIDQITNIYLRNNELIGTLPVEIGSLNSLEELFVDRNQLTGNIPTTIGQLTNIRSLNLSNNQISGVIPAEITNLVNLSFLDLSRNDLSGGIPVNFNGLLNLENLYLNNNQLSGSISEIGQLSQLEKVDISVNGFTGNIPTELGNATNLVYVNFGGNQLSGNIPAEFGNLISLKDLFLYDNQLSGSIPPELGALVNIEDLYLQNNLLSGIIPVELGNLTRLVRFYLNNNQLRGVIPSSFNNLASLTDLVLNVNNLSGNIPSGIVNLLNLNAVMINSNEFVFSDFELEFNTYQTKLGTNFGFTPQAKVDQTETVSVTEGGSITLSSTTLTSPNNSYQWYKDGVAITGATSKDLIIENATTTDAGVYHFLATNSIVTDLTLERNPITLDVNPVVDTCGVSDIEKQALIDLYNSTDGANWTNNTNWLTDAPVCDWYGVTVVNGKLTMLRLPSNNLEGSISNSIDNLISLEDLNLGNNLLNGIIPEEIYNLEFLKTLSLASNKLSGNLSSNIVNLINLEELKLHGNLLTGELPTELGSLSNLSLLLLESNDFSGELPAEIGNLGNLFQIELAFNNFTGLIPDSFENLSALQVFRLNNNDFSGDIPLGLLSISSFSGLKVENNNFVFSNLESFINVFNSNSKNSYAPQAKVDQTETVSVTEGGSITLTSTALTSPNNSYQWYKDGVAITGATSKDLVLSSATIADAGVYHFLATNSVVTDLTLERNPITVTVNPVVDTCGVSDEEKQALIDLYNSTDGANWTNNTNWLTDAPVCDWYGVTVEDEKVTKIQLSNNNLIGTIPSSLTIVSNLKQIVLNNNYLEGTIPDFTNQPLEGFAIQNNGFIFSDFEAQFIQYEKQLGASFVYSPQAPVDQQEFYTFTGTESITVGSNQLTSVNNSYQWFKNGEPILGATSKEYMISASDIERNGLHQFYFIATNSVVKDLQLARRIVYVNYTGDGITPPSGEDSCDILLENGADGTFDSCEPNLAADAYELVTCAGWDVFYSDPKSFNASSSARPLVFALPKQDINIGESPQGGLVTLLGSTQQNSLLNNSNVNYRLPSFFTSIRNLEVGKEYYVTFYQANATRYELRKSDTDFGGWKVEFGDDVKYSPPSFMEESPKWTKVTISFIATETAQTLTFSSYADYIGQASLGDDIPYVRNILIDGIQVISPSPCVERSTIQRYCSSEEGITIGDLSSPFDTDAIWYTNATGGEPMLQETVINESKVLWAQSETSSERQAIQIILDISIRCNEATTQAFCTNGEIDIRVSDLTSPFPGETNWYTSATGGVIAFPDMIIFSGGSTGLTVLYAEEVGGNNTRRTRVTVILNDSAPKGDTVQTFDQSANPTVADLLAAVPNSGFGEIQWYSSALTQDPLSADTSLINNTYYYAATSAITCRLKVLVNVNTDVTGFCLSQETPTVADLESPFDGIRNVTWYSSETGGFPLPLDYELVESFVYWAQGNIDEPRLPVEINVHNGIEGFDVLDYDYQRFNLISNATVSDLAPKDLNITWYTTPVGGFPVAGGVSLNDGDIYYGQQGNNPCRFEVSVVVGVFEPEGDQYQSFCASDDPTFEDLQNRLEVEDQHILVFYTSESGDTQYNLTDPLVSGINVYVAQRDSNGNESSRKAITINVFVVPPPQVTNSDQIFYSNDPLFVSDLVATGSGILWYDEPFGGTAYSDSDQLVSGETYYAAQSDGGCGILGQTCCESLQREAVTVTILEEVPPTLIACETFRPKPGDRYVISGWVRENGVTPVDPRDKPFEEVSDVFVDFMNHILHDKILSSNQGYLNRINPEKYVVERREFDVLIPYIKNSVDRNLTMYKFEFVKERQFRTGPLRTVGFSFALEPSANAQRFEYKTPYISINGVQTSGNGRYPLIQRNNEIPMELRFKDIEFCGTRACLTSSFSISGQSTGLIYNDYSYTNENIETSNFGGSGLKEKYTVYSYNIDPEYQVKDYRNSLLSIQYAMTNDDGDLVPLDGTTVNFNAKGAVIDGWQRISADFTIPIDATNMIISLKTNPDEDPSVNINAYFDDIRVHPFDGNMKTFVYDPLNQRLKSELDENNYGTYYEYDQEGGLIRVKKETERGVYTIQETRSGNAKRNN